MKNRWLIALAAVGIHLSIGSIYAYSVLKIPLFDHYGWADAVKEAFPIAIVCLGLSAAFMGHFVERHGPRRSATVAAIAYGIGVLGAGLACLFASQSIQPARATALSDPGVQAALVSAEAGLRPDAVAVVANQAVSGPTAHMIVADLIAEPPAETVGGLVDAVIAQSNTANAAVGTVAAGDAIALQQAKAHAETARAVKQVVIEALITPVASGWQWLFLLCYGVFGGIGLGVGYISPVSTLVKWFPDRRGLATGLAIMGFGFASLIFAPTMNALIAAYNPAVMFLVLGVVYLVLMLSSAAYLAPPPPGWMTEPAVTDAAQSGAGRAKPATAARPAKPVRVVKQDLSQLTANEAIGTRRFYYLWLMLFINVTCGIALISVASPMAQEMVGLSPAQAAAMVGLMGLFNGIGRLGWASISDYLGRSNTYLAFFLIQIAAFLCLPHVVAYAVLFQVVVFMIVSCYGGGFASIPAFIGDIFGTRQLGAIHGYVLTAWAAAGIAGPRTATYVREMTGDYALTLTIFAGAFVLALIVNVLMKLDMARLRRQQDAGRSNPSARPTRPAPSAAPAAG